MGGLLLNYQILASYSSSRMFGNAADVPKATIGVVLGTARYLNPRIQRQNLYFNYRMDAAAALFKAGRVKYLLVSGNNYDSHATEVVDMRAALVRRGVPLERILGDPKGLRTLDSILRCKQVFGQSRFVVISQPFHNERAIFLSRQHNLEVFAYNAKPVRDGLGTLLREQIREHLARVKAVLDVFVLSKKARFPGKPRRLPFATQATGK